MGAGANASAMHWAAVRSRWETGSHKEDHLLGLFAVYKRRLEGPPVPQVAAQAGELALGGVTDLGVGVDLAEVAGGRREDARL